ncbi:hypothetical protein JCM10295v2_003861 [Rhodotorula toruloides]
MPPMPWKRGISRRAVTTPHYLLSELEAVDSMIEEIEEIRQEVLFLQGACPEDLLPHDDKYGSEDSDLPDPKDPSWHLWEEVRQPAFLRSESRPDFWDVDSKQDFHDALEGLQQLTKKAELGKLNVKRRQAIEARFLRLAGFLNSRSRSMQKGTCPSRVAGLLDPLPNVVEFCQLEPVKSIYQVDSVEDIDQETSVSRRPRQRHFRGGNCGARAIRQALFLRLVELLTDLQRKIDWIEPPKPAVQLLPLENPQAVITNAETYQDALLSRASSLLQCRTCRRAGHISRIASQRCEILHHPAPLDLDKYSCL